MSAAYEITSDQDNIIIRVPRELADQESLVKLLDYLELETLRRRSQINEEDAAALASEVKQGAWQQIKHLFVGP